MDYIPTHRCIGFLDLVFYASPFPTGPVVSVILREYLEINYAICRIRNRVVSEVGRAPNGILALYDAVLSIYATVSDSV